MKGWEVILIVVAVIAVVVILGWRSGGLWGSKMARDAEREREIDDA